MLSTAVDTLTVTGGGSYTFPVGFKALTQVVYTSEDRLTYDPAFTDYTLVGNTITIPSTYSGTFDLYYNYTAPSPALMLESLYTNVVSDIGEDPDTLLAKDTNGNFVDTVSFGKIRKELNRAVRKIAREYFNTSLIEQVTLDDNLMFDVTALTKNFYSITLLADTDGREFSYERASTAQYKVPDGTAGQSLNLTYCYIPTDMVNLTDTADLPEGAVDPGVIVDYADYRWFEIDGNTRKANQFLQDFNDGVSGIYQSRGEPKVIKNVYDW